jgi:hypothetical protein
MPSELEAQERLQVLVSLLYPLSIAAVFRQSIVHSFCRGYRHDTSRLFFFQLSECYRTTAGLLAGRSDGSLVIAGKKKGVRINLNCFIPLQL